MNYFKLILIALLFAFQSLAQSNSIARCISGTYSGRADFTIGAWGDASYHLEVATNGYGDVIFLARATEDTYRTRNGSMVCSLYKGVELGSFWNSSDLVGESIEHRGIISHTYGFPRVRVSQTSNGECGFTRLNLLRSKYSGAPLIRFGGSEHDPPPRSNTKAYDISKESNQARSFDELSYLCGFTY